MSTNSEKIALRKKTESLLRAGLVESLDLKLSPDDICGDLALVGSGMGLDSLDVLEVVMCVETVFGVKIREGDNTPLRSFNTLVDYIIENLKSV